jgi:hypothetical protein
MFAVCVVFQINYRSVRSVTLSLSDSLALLIVESQTLAVNLLMNVQPHDFFIFAHFSYDFPIVDQTQTN